MPKTVGSSDALQYARGNLLHYNRGGKGLGLDCFSEQLTREGLMKEGINPAGKNCLTKGVSGAARDLRLTPDAYQCGERGQSGVVFRLGLGLEAI